MSIKFVKKTTTTFAENIKLTVNLFGNAGATQLAHRALQRNIALTTLRVSCKQEKGFFFFSFTFWLYILVFLSQYFIYILYFI